MAQTQAFQPAEAKFAIAREKAGQGIWEEEAEYPSADEVIEIAEKFLAFVNNKMAN